MTGIVAVGVFVIGLTLQGAPPETANKVKDGPRGALKSGAQGVLQMGTLPVFDPLPADYRRSSETVVRTVDGVTAIGAPVWETPGGMLKSLTGECSIDEQCATCNVCQTYACEGGKCIITSELGANTEDCDDGLYCNGEELCVDEGGEPMCVPAIPGDTPSITCADGGQICDESQDACVALCEDVTDCDDLNENTVDTCEPSGLCSHFNPSVLGRCCDDEKACSAVTAGACETQGGVFLAMNAACEVLQPSGNTNGCPDYGSGIAPQGDYIFEVGPISDLDCEILHEVGDDYQMQNYPADQYMQVKFLRFAAVTLDQPVNGARWQIAFYDAGGIKIEDVFWPDGTNDFTGTGIRTVDFDPPLTVPTKGFVVFSVMSNFGLDGRVKVLSTDCPADKGENACSTMWINGAVVDYLGMCNGGDLDGEQCDRRNGNADCTGDGTCEDVDDVLAFELIGTATGAPNEACCDSVADCQQKLPWVCADEGGTPQGEGTLCSFCTGDVNVTCTVDQDCIDAGTTGPCIDLATCETQACCDESTGGCVEVTGIGTPCPGASVAQGYGTDCDPNCCVLPSSLYTGLDNCGMPPPLIINVPELGQLPITITITGDNTAATFDDFPDICNSNIFDPDGVNKDPGWWEGFTLDACAEVRIDLCCTDIDGSPLRPQWSALVRDELDDEMCCDTWLQNVGVDPPIGIGRGTSGYARGGPFCDADNLWATWGPVPAGTYYKMIYSAPDGSSASPPGAQYQMHITVGACPLAACCVGEVCSVMDEYECGELGGYWHYGVVDCGTQPDCNLAGSDGLCCTGACCRGPGDCIDQTPTSEPIDEELCLAEPGEPVYIGGIDCTANPCPVCNVENEENCHTWDSNWYWPIDRLNGGGYAIADDFVPVGDEIRQICWWGMYAIAEQFLAGCPAAAIPTEDFFEIRFFEDAGGVPGAELANSPGPVVVTAKAALGTEEPISYQYSVKFDTPISVTPGATYWVEISGAGDPGGECQWWMATSYRGNGYSLIEGDPNMEEWTVEDRVGYIIDFALCLDTGDGGVGFDPPDPPIGACCECSGTCTDIVWNDCSGGYDVDTNALVGAFIGQWEPGDTCAAKAVTCSGEPPPGDDCSDPLVLSGGVVSELISTWCSTTDGASGGTTGRSCDSAASGTGLWTYGIENDVWIAYTPVSDGTFEMDMCADTDFDVVLEVYTGGDAACPTCPPDPALRVPNFVNDDALCTDLECQTPPDWSFKAFVTAGDCYLIRIGGERNPDLAELDPVGRGLLDIKNELTECPVSIPPLEDANTPEQGSGTKNRYMSVDPTELAAIPDPVDTHALRVTFTTLPGFEFAEGRTMWIQEPYPVTEASGSNLPTPLPTFLAAELGCVPFYADWSGYGVIDVFNDAIIPGAVFDVQAIDFACDRSVEGSYSSSLQVVMSGVGDVVRLCDVQPCSSPQGIVDFVDISAVVDKFRNLLSAPRKARADVINSDVSRPKPDQKVDFVDISTGVDAFRNLAQPPVGPPADDPCPGGR